jgi:hypothetical protein
MGLGRSFVAALVVCALTAGTLWAQELPMDTPNDQDGPRIIDPDLPSLLVNAPDDLVQSIRADAALRAGGIDPATVQISVSQPIDWSDASLGCPQHRQAYAQVITPGFLIVVDAGANRLSYHTDTSGRFVVCDGPVRPAGVGIDLVR